MLSTTILGEERETRSFPGGNGVVAVLPKAVATLSTSDDEIQNRKSKGHGNMLYLPGSGPLQISFGAKVAWAAIVIVA